MIIKFAAASIFGATLCLVGGAVCAATVSKSRATTSITDYFGFLSDWSFGGVVTTTYAPNSAARPQIGDIGLKLDASESASGDLNGRASFKEEITVTGGDGDGVLSLAFDVEGSITVPAGSFVDMNWVVSTLSLSDAPDARAGMTVDWGNFVGLDTRITGEDFDNETTPVTSDEGWFSLVTATSGFGRPDFSLPVGPLAETYDNTILLDVLFTYDVPFTVSLFMQADLFDKATLDFFNSATLTGVAVSDAQGAPAPAAAVMGVGGGDLRALAAANAGAPITPVPLPPAAWMLGVALAALGLVRRRRA